MNAEANKITSSQVLVVLVTVPTKDKADALAMNLVESRLAACVNIISNVNSVFRWQGKVEHAEELLLMIKTTSARFDRLQAKILDLHPYDTPEVVALPPIHVFEKYAQWVINETKEQSG